MSSKNCSLAIDETKQQSQNYDVGFEPKLKVLVNQRLLQNSLLGTEPETIRIEGRITVSF